MKKFIHSRIAARMCLAALVVLAACASAAPAQVRLAATTGVVEWSSRARAASGNGISILARVFVPTTASSGELAIGVGEGTGVGRHGLHITAAGVVSVTGTNSVGDERTTSYTNTHREGRWVWYGVRIPTTFIGGGAVNAQAWIDINGTWTAATVNTTGADPAGTIGNTAGTVSIVNTTDAACVVGPLWIWSGADAPDAASEFRSIALGSADPAAYTGLIFSAELAGNSTDTYGVDASGVETGATFVTHNGLPWGGYTGLGVRYHTLRDYDFSTLPIGAATAVTNLALTGGDLATAASMTACDVVDNPYGVRAAYMGAQEGGGGSNRAMDSAANGPIIRNDYCTVFIVGGTWHSADGSTVNTLVDTGSTDLRVDILNLNRFGLNANTTDALHRAPSTPSVFALRLAVSTPVDHWLGNDGLQSHASFTCGSTTRESQTFRVGAALGGTSTNTRYWFQRVIVFEGVVADADVTAIIASLGAYHNCRHYVSGVSRLICAEGTSSFAGTWDYNAKGGAVHRTAGLAPRTTIVYDFGTSGHTMTEILVSDDTTVRYVSETLHPGAVRKTLITQLGRNDAEAGTSSATIISNIGTFATANKPYYDRWIAFEAHPSYFSVDQAAKSTVLVAVNDALPGVTGVDRVVPSFFRNWGVGGDFTNAAYYVEGSSQGVHLDSAGHDASDTGAWRGPMRVELGGGSRRRRQMRVGGIGKWHSGKVAKWRGAPRPPRATVAA